MRANRIPASSPTWSSSSVTRRVVVHFVGNNTATVYDFETNNDMEVILTAPGGVLPLVGDIWEVTNRSASGMWQFQACLERNRSVEQSSMGDVLRALEQAGIIRWRPDHALDERSIDGTSYIGEMRLFPTSIEPKGWLPVNGSSQSVTRWRRLFRKIGTAHGGNGTTTFNMPTITSPAGFHWLMCAE